MPKLSDYSNAVNGRGPLAPEWEDKPHRLVYDLVNLSDELLKALKRMVQWYGGWHDSDCPADDTCACAGKEFNRQVNQAITKAEGRDA